MLPILSAEAAQASRVGYMRRVMHDEIAESIG
jgi:hypothetical protein